MSELKDLQRAWSETTTEYREEKAREIAKEITIRSYVDGTSHDDKRPTTKVEADYIFDICMAAMNAWGYRVHTNNTESLYEGILDMAEFMMHRFMPEANAYDTVYLPLRKALETISVKDKPREPQWKTEYEAEYVKSLDMSILFEFTSKDNEPATQTLVAWGYGELSTDELMKYKNKLTAWFID